MIHNGEALPCSYPAPEKLQNVFEAGARSFFPNDLGHQTLAAYVFEKLQNERYFERF
jgi:hypothetical protein